MVLTKESKELLIALRSDATAIAHAALTPAVSIKSMYSTKRLYECLSSSSLYSTCYSQCALQKGATARLQELVQTWPNKSKDALGEAVSHQVSC